MPDDRIEKRPDDESLAPAVVPSRGAPGLRFRWEPKPVEPPTVNPDLPVLPPVERSAEVLRYSIRRAEYWASPDGGLREWFRLNLFLAVLIGLPAAMLAPIISYLLGEVSLWVSLLLEIVKGLAMIAGISLALYLVLRHVGRTINKREDGRKGRGQRR